MYVCRKKARGCGGVLPASGDSYDDKKTCRCFFYIEGSRMLVGKNVKHVHTAYGPGIFAIGGGTRGRCVRSYAAESGQAVRINRTIIHS